MTAHLEETTAIICPVYDSQWHHQPIQEVAFLLETDLENGLNTKSVTKKQAEFGLNELNVKPGKDPWLRFLLQFNQPLLYLLLIAGFVKILLGSWTNALVIWGVTLFNAAIGYVQESKAEEVISTLVKTVTAEAIVMRDGKKVRINAKELVPGDLVILTPGDKVTADLRLVTAENLQVDESHLTGQLLSVIKSTYSLREKSTLSDRSNMVYAGSFITLGQGIGIAIATGDNTEIAKISQVISTPNKLSTPLTRKFAKFNNALFEIVLTLASFVFVLGVGRGQSWSEMFEAMVTLVVSAIPEGLPAVIAVTLAMGVARMVRRHAIVRKLAAIETLSGITVICSDTTGTLTENQMTVQKIYAGEQRFTVGGTGYNQKGTIWESNSLQPVYFSGRILDYDSQQQIPVSQIALQECLMVGLLCNNSHLKPRENQWVVVGDSTEGALIVVGHKAGLSQSVLEEIMPRLDVIPFQPEYQCMVTLHKNTTNYQHTSLITDASDKTIYVKGSLEVVLKRCEQMVDKDGNIVALDLASVEKEAEIMSKQGLRVLAFAKKLVGNEFKVLACSAIDSGLIFLGLQGMIDPPRQEVFTAIKSCHSAGIQVKMITGDHINTAVAIADEFGLSKNAEIIAYSGEQLAQMDDAELKKVAKAGVVFARVTPSQKIRLVDALQSQGEIVAITGNKVNDAPALKQADIGFAMGIQGTDITKESADIILMDDNFASIKVAVEEGRAVYQNLRKAIAFVLPFNSGELLAVLIAALMAWQLPILSLQILWINMVNCITMTVTLAFEPKPKLLMRQSPRNPGESLLPKPFLSRILLVSVFNLILILGLFTFIFRTTGNLAVARTMAIESLIAGRIIYLLSLSNAIVSQLTNSGAILLGIFCTIILQILFSQWSVMNMLFGTAPLSFQQWLICLILSLGMIPVAIYANKLDPID